MSQVRMIGMAAATLVLAVGVRAQQGQAPTPPAAPLPVAVSSLALMPDEYLGQTVSLYAPVEESLSATTFSVDADANRRATPLILVVAPSLVSAPSAGAYVTVVGIPIRLSPEELQRRARRYQLDLSPAQAEAFLGKTVVLATAVYDGTMTDLAKAPLLPPTPKEVALSNVMKQINQASSALRAGVGESNSTEVATQAGLLRGLFEQTGQLFVDLKADDALAWAAEGASLAATIPESAGANRWDEAKESASKVTSLCQSCHAAYRVRVEDGTYRIRSERD